eukprot:290100-Amphidinium_carterae.1
MTCPGWGALQLRRDVRTSNKNHLRWFRVLPCTGIPGDIPWYCESSECKDSSLHYTYCPHFSFFWRVVPNLFSDV